MPRSTRVVALTLLLAGFGTTHTEGGLIVDFLGAVGPGLGDARVGIFGGTFHRPGSENNDNSPDSPNFFTLTKTFARTAEIDMFFLVRDSQGTTEYFLSDTVRNNTLDTWFDYHFELGFGSGANFQQSSLLDFLDFDTPERDPRPASNRFATLSHEANTIDWSNGMMPPGDVGVFTLSLDIPDFMPGAMPSEFRHVFPDGSVGYVFTLRQVPTVPEPSTLLLTAAGIASLLRGARRQGR